MYRFRGCGAQRVLGATGLRQMFTLSRGRSPALLGATTLAAAQGGVSISFRSQRRWSASAAVEEDISGEGAAPSGGDVADGASGSAAPQAKFYQCSSCQRTFRLADAAQHHINTRHNGNAEVVVVDVMTREKPTPTTSSGGHRSHSSHDPNGTIQGLAGSAQQPNFPPPPKRKPLPESDLSPLSFDAIMKEALEVCPRLRQGPIGSPLAEEDPTDLLMDASRKQTLQLSLQSQVMLDAQTPDGPDAAVHSSCVNDITLMGFVESVSCGFDEREVPCIQLRVRTDGKPVAGASAKASESDVGGPDSEGELHFVRRLRYSEAEKSQLMSLKPGAVVLLKGSVKNVTLFHEVLVERLGAPEGQAKASYSSRLPVVQVPESGITVISSPSS